MAIPKSDGGGNADSASPSPAAPVADPGGQATSGVGTLPLLAAIGFCLVLVYAGVRMGFHRWGRHRRLEVRRRREAEWKATLRQIELAQAPEVSSPNGDQLERIGVESDFAPLAVGVDEAVSQDRASPAPAKAG